MPVFEAATLPWRPAREKTWLAKRLAYALVGVRSDETVHALQFHPTLAYEDFVRGWRPGHNGRLELLDGPFMQAVQAAHRDDRPHVVVVEEINRGNPAQILGEMLTLIENDKRAQEHALRLSHMHEGEPPVFLPPNLYLIGTMNIADRSLALVYPSPALARLGDPLSLGNREQDLAQTRQRVKEAVRPHLESIRGAPDRQRPR